MSFDWLDYLLLARELSGQDDVTSSEEAKLRAAISRTYYAMFCKARNMIRAANKNFGNPKTGEAHKLVQRIFRESKISFHQSIAANLNRLQVLREQADYEDQVSDLSAKVDTALALAENIVANFEKGPAPKIGPSARL